MAGRSIVPTEQTKRISYDSLIAGDHRAIEARFQLLDHAQNENVRTADEITIGIEASGLERAIRARTAQASYNRHRCRQAQTRWRGGRPAPIDRSRCLRRLGERHQVPQDRGSSAQALLDLFPLIEEHDLHVRTYPRGAALIVNEGDQPIGIGECVIAE
jgi:hypothetical protein